MSTGISKEKRIIVAFKFDIIMQKGYSRLHWDAKNQLYLWSGKPYLPHNKREVIRDEHTYLGCYQDFRANIITDKGLVYLHQNNEAQL